MVVLSPMLALAGFYRPLRVTKLTQQDTPQYALSNEFILDPGDDLHNVLGVLKQLSVLLTQDSN